MVTETEWGVMAMAMGLLIGLLGCGNRVTGLGVSHYTVNPRGTSVES